MKTEETKSNQSASNKARVIITPAQLRAARGLLDWSRADLAKAAGMSQETIKNIEHGVYKPQEATLEAISRAFAIHDVEFTENEGVRKRKSQIKTFVGKQGYIEFLDYIYDTLKTHGGRIRQFNLGDELLSFAGDYSLHHVKRMTEIKGLDARVLVKKNYNGPYTGYCSYRRLNKEQEILAPYYVFGHYVSMPSMKNSNSLEIVLIFSEFLSNIFAEQFDAIWHYSSPIERKRTSQSK